MDESVNKINIENQNIINDWTTDNSKSELVSSLNKKNIWETINFIGIPKDLIDRDFPLEKITNPELESVYIINNEFPWEYEGHEVGDPTDLYWLEIAKDILFKNPSAKIILLCFTPFSYIEKNMKHKNVEMLFKSPNVLYKRFITFDIKELNQISFGKIENKISYELLSAEAKTFLGKVKHDLREPREQRYNLENEQIRNKVEPYFNKFKIYFPDVNGINEMLDFAFYVKLDVPEKMPWKRIEWVYCDVDWTLIEYVPIWSDLEWKQKLRSKVVEALKKYESEWKEIFIWTWWDVEQKAAYLKSLWINWPVVSKYDYSWATAEIVVDDTDINLFKLQSKITPETYIDTKDWD